MVYSRPAEHFVLLKTAAKFGLHADNIKSNAQNEERKSII